MALRIIKAVVGHEGESIVAQASALHQYYANRTLRCTVLRHFDNTRRLVGTLNESFDAFYYGGLSLGGGAPAGLRLPSSLVRKYGVLNGEFLEVLITDVLPATASKGHEAAEPVFPMRDVVEADFEPDQGTVADR